MNHASVGVRSDQSGSVPGPSASSACGSAVQLKGAVARTQGFGAQEAMLQPGAEGAPTAGGGAPVQRSGRAVQRGVIGELWEGITTLPTVIRNNRRLDHDRELAQLNERLSPIKSTLDAMAEAAESGGPRIQGLSRRVSQIQSGLQALDYIDAVSDALEIVGEWEDAQAAWAEHQANPTTASARRAAREAGNVIAPLGRILGRFPPPIGPWAGLLAEANGAWFEGVVGNILHSAHAADEIDRCETERADRQGNPIPRPADCPR